jgi:geranylgeranyl diphosphate synthase type I
MTFEKFRTYVGKWKPRVDGAIMSELARWEAELPELHGWAQAYFRAGGKRIRPALVLLGAKEAGGREEDALELAAAVEMLHNFTLIHDDIEDRSDYRRGEPTLYKAIGTELAINVGDGIYSRSFSLAAGYGPEVVRAFADTGTTIMEGQDMDIRWSRKRDWVPSEDEYIEMVRRKTSVLVGSSLELGFMAASGRRNREIYGYGEALGVAFQITDDLLGIFGDPKKTGKDADKDIAEGKRSLPIIYAVRNHEEGKGLLKLLDKPKKSAEDVARMKRLVRDSGAVGYCTGLAREWTGRATYGFKVPEVREYLEGFKEFIIEREF